jgi:NAD(P)-dependent dehydrogenase (short-subunit alcohol dehydrogenase family)
VTSVPEYLSSLFSLDGRLALVTGGSSGIGEGIAVALAGAGARVVLLARDKARLEAACSRTGAAGWVSADAADRAALTAAAGEVTARFGEPDILVNAAAVNLRPPLGEQTTASWDQTIEANLTAPFLLGQAFGPRMAERGWGRIINITSQQAHRAFGNSGGYGAAKGGLAALTRSQSEAWAPRGVCANALAPGFVITPLTAEVSADPVRVAAYAARTHVGRNGLPADFAGAAVLLASPASGYVTGQMICVDGGFSVS